HDRRSERGSASSRPPAGVVAARRAAIGGVRPAENVVVAPKAVGGEQRDVGRVAHTIVGIAPYGFAGRLWPSRARTPDNTRSGRGGSACCALAGTAATCDGRCEEGTEEGVVTQAG